jgi:hypothetical protein
MDEISIENTTVVEPPPSSPIDVIVPVSAQDAPMKKSLAELVSELSNVPEIQFNAIPTSLIGIEPLEAESILDGAPEPTPFTLGSDPLVFTFLAPAYVSFLLLDGTATIAAKVEVQFQDENGVLSRAPLRKTNDGKFRADIGSVARRLEVVRTSRGKQVRVISAQLFGFCGTGSTSWIHTYHEFAEQVEFCREQLDQENASLLTLRSNLEDATRLLKAEQESWRNDLETQKNDLLQVKISVKEASDEKILLDKTLEESKIELASIAAAAQTQASRMASAQAQSEAMESEISEKESYRDNLAHVIEEKNAKLTQINRDTTIMATSLTGYGQQGKSQARWYFWFAVACGLFGIATAVLSYWQGTLIWGDIVKAPEKISVSMVLVTRLTMFTVFSATIGGLYALANLCVKRVVQIDDRTLRLSEISVLAGDVTGAMPYPSDATEDQKQAVFFATRTMLIRNLLSGTFEKIRKTPKQEKEQLLESFKASDLVELAKVLKDSGISKH